MEGYDHARLGDRGGWVHRIKHLKGGNVRHGCHPARKRAQRTTAVFRAYRVAEAAHAADCGALRVVRAARVSDSSANERGEEIGAGLRGAEVDLISARGHRRVEESLSQSGARVHLGLGYGGGDRGVVR